MSLVSTCVYVIRACILIPIYCILYSIGVRARRRRRQRRPDIRRVMLALFALLFFVVLFLMLFPLVFFTPIVLVLFSSLSLAPIVVLVHSGTRSRRNPLCSFFRAVLLSARAFPSPPPASWLRERIMRVSISFRFFIGAWVALSMSCVADRKCFVW